jgi:hypothetical protein
MESRQFKDVPVCGYFSFDGKVYIKMSPGKIRTFGGDKDIKFAPRTAKVQYYGQDMNDVLDHIVWTRHE